MALIVETGQAGSDSESYVSVTNADTYFSNRGNATWAALATAAKEQALRKATDYMGQVYRLRWAGYRISTTQALDWPRYEVPRKDTGSGGYYASYYADNAVPTEVVNACCELAVRASAETLSADLDAPAIREKVGPIEIERAQGVRETKKYPAVDNLLAPVLTGSSGSMKVSRA